jgi:hypothetical protein
LKVDREITEFQRDKSKTQVLNVLREILNHGRLVDLQHTAIIRDSLNNNNYDRALEGIIFSNLA